MFFDRGGGGCSPDGVFRGSGEHPTICKIMSAKICLDYLPLPRSLALALSLSLFLSLALCLSLSLSVFFHSGFHVWFLPKVLGGSPLCLWTLVGTLGLLCVMHHILNVIRHAFTHHASCVHHDHASRTHHALCYHHTSCNMSCVHVACIMHCIDFSILTYHASV